MKNELTDCVIENAREEVKKLLFNVELGDINVNTSNYPGQIPADYFKAVVAFKADKDPEIFSIVTNNYRLVSNDEGIQIGKQIFKEMFNNINVDEISPIKVIYPKSKSYCHIQMVHKTVNFDVWEQDTWLPFIQISNSYNRTYALTYELGFVRKLCCNGVIFRKKTVDLKSYHNKTDRLEWKLNVGIQEMKALQLDFIAHMKNLKRYYINPNYILPLTCKVFDFKFDLKNKSLSTKTAIRQQKQFDEIKNVVTRLSAHYFDGMGHNAYAAFNILTDLISNESENISMLNNFSLHATSYYYKPTEWMNDFLKQIQQDNFDIEEYLTDFISLSA